MFYSCETGTRINTTTSYNSAKDRILCLLHRIPSYTMFTIDVTRSIGRWRMRRAVNDSPAGVPILLQVFYSSMAVP